MRAHRGRLTIHYLALFSTLAASLAGCQAGSEAFKPSPTFPDLTQNAPKVEPTAPAAGTPVPTLQPAPSQTPYLNLAQNAIDPSSLGRLEEVSHFGKGALLGLAVSPDGRLIAFATRRGVELYDAHSYQPLRSFSVAGGAFKVTFLNDSQTVAAADWNARITLFHVQDGSVSKVLDGGEIGQPLSLVPFADGKTLSLGTNGELNLLWDLDTGKLNRWYTSGASAMAGSPDGQYLATSNFSGSIFMWLTADGSSPGRLWRDSNVECLQFSPDSQLLAAGYGDNVAVLWKVIDGKRAFTLTGNSERVSAVAFSPDSKILASGSWDGTVRLWDTGTGQEIRSLDGKGGRIQQISFNRDGRSLLSLSSDGLVRVWNAADGSLARQMDDFAPLGRAVFSPDGKTLASGAEDGVWRLWKVAGGSLLQAVAAHPGGISALRFSPDGQLLATGGLDNAVRLWRTSDGSLVKEMNDNDGVINSLDFSTDGKILAASTNSASVHLWSLVDTSEASLDTGGETVLKVAFDPGSEGLWVAAMDGSLKEWKVSDGSLIATFLSNGPFVSSLALTADGQWLAAGGEGPLIYLWQLGGSTLFHMIDGLKTVGVSSLAYSADGQLVFASFWDKALRVYSAADRSLLKTWNFDYNVRDLAISPDGSLLALSLDDGTIRLWGVK